MTTGGMRHMSEYVHDFIWTMRFFRITDLLSQYEMLVDIHARYKRRKPKFELKTLYGRLQHLFAIHFQAACGDLGLDCPTTVILAAIRTCILEDDDTLRSEVLDIHTY